jgi:uncharacterized Zn finger protein (UPF0148 family)
MAKLTCPNCGQEVFIGWAYCPFCGFPLRETVKSKSVEKGEKEVKKEKEKK